MGNLVRELAYTAGSHHRVKMFAMSPGPFCGILILDKTAGVTSRDVVNVVQKLVRPAKAGHAGTLDPLATGVLVVGVGQATRLVEFIQELPKTYTATFLLGRKSDTEDVTGEVIELPEGRRPNRGEMEDSLPRFTGAIVQRPPAYSALKLQGRRAYELARRGEEPALAPRPIVVHSIAIRSYEWPELTLQIECGSGTYVRSLGRDLAECLGTSAVMSALVREAIGPFCRANSLAVDRLTLETLGENLRPLADAVAHLPSLRVSMNEIARLQRGQSITRMEIAVEREIAALDEAGNLVAILARRQPGEWRPVKNFTH